MDDRGSPRSSVILEAAGDLFRTLAAPLRLAIVIELASGPRSVHELVDALGASQPLISQHLRILRGARLVTAQRRRRERVYTMADEHVSHIVLDALKHVEEDG